MKINTLHSTLQKTYKALALFCAVWLIFSTCSMQTTLTHLLHNDPVSLEQTTKTNKAKKHTTVTERSCQQNVVQDDNTSLLQQAGWDISNPFVAIFVTTFLLFFFGFRLIEDENNHPLYKNTSQLQGKLPLFIEFQNLRI